MSIVNQAHRELIVHRLQASESQQAVFSSARFESAVVRLLNLMLGPTALIEALPKAQVNPALARVRTDPGQNKIQITLQGLLRKVVNPAFGLAGLELTSRKRTRTIEEYLPLQETLAGAKAAGLSVGDYIDRKHNPGATQQTIEQIVKLGVFEKRIERTCEIGPGSGRYLEKIVPFCRPGYYEIYETAEDWGDWLAETYQVVSQPCDRISLAHTPSKSIDLAHSHKLFVGLPFLVTCHYLAEMARVVWDGGWVIFDVLTEDCLDEKNLPAWFSARAWVWEWTPAVMPKQYLCDYLSGQGLSLVSSFFISHWPGRTEVFVFRKEPRSLPNNVTVPASPVSWDHLSILSS
ncbi:MAG TPA: phospholipid methyltransferase [Candidatus Dormibacteraeota bacterium]|nr:phospholipid methyltransferase [Candidatus Dormibacteraeota bacterium]